MICLHCYVRFTSALDLEAVAAVLADRLFGGVPFVPTDEFDEAPGVRLARSVLGLYVSICGAGPAFGLRMQSLLPPSDSDDLPQLQFQNISPYLEQLLATVHEISIIDT